MQNENRRIEQIGQAMEWIKTSERLPSEDGFVLAWRTWDGGLEEILMPFYNPGYKEFPWHHEIDGFLKIDHFQYWMPLPKPPKD